MTKASNEVEAAQLAASFGCLHARDDRRDDQRRKGLAGEQERGDGQRPVGVVVDGQHEGEQTEPAAEAVDRVGEDDPAAQGLAASARGK